MKQIKKNAHNTLKLMMSNFMVLFLLAVHSFAGGDKYAVDQVHSYVGFSVKHLMISTVKGNFTDFSGTINVEGKMVTGAEGAIKASTINTNNKKRDGHLAGADFFEVEKYP